MSERYDILHVDTSCATRAVGMIALGLDELAALRVAATYRAGIDAHVSTSGKETPAHVRACASFRSRIMSACERAGATQSYAMLKAIPPKFLRAALADRGALAFHCPVAGTFVLAPSDAGVDVAGVTDTSARARELASAARPGIVAATRARAELTSGD